MTVSPTMPTMNGSNPVSASTCISKTISMFFLALLLAGSCSAQSAQPRGSDPLHQLNESIETLVARISPSVVQILVSGYGAVEQNDSSQTSLVIGRQRKIGSGVIVDADGYILTNAHVVNGADRIEVLVPNVPTATLSESLNPRGQSFVARVIGVSKEMDIALIKVESHGMPAIKIDASIAPRQGEMVFAFGSPGGLRNSVTMGVVSAVARQADPSSAMVYIQTDAPINPGNSGGPLVDADGNLIGINTFILTESGGNEGLGFAIPTRALSFAYPELLKFGHVHQPEIGATVQTITPDLAAGLHLSRDFGVIISDVVPGGPADAAGLKIQDIVLSIDGQPAGSLPLFAHNLYLHHAGERSHLEVLRGSQRLEFDVAVSERPHSVDKLADFADPQKNLVSQLGILGIELNLSLAKQLPDLRVPSGVIVAAKTTTASQIPLEAGDVIHGVNGVTVTNLAELRAALQSVKSGDAIVLQIERDQKLSYVAFQLS
ncbi:MAG TPA: trypsin-like peptidase domain-containing protein [Candidatus Acidoferrales bacterium]|nr:trypsin-like peptidase domain-containing protein [Candidatus Acidoferrales bacterium]